MKLKLVAAGLLILGTTIVCAAPPKEKKTLLVGVQGSHSVPVLAKTMQPLINYLAAEMGTNIRWETASRHKTLIDRIKNNRYDILFVDTPTTLLSYYQANYRPIVRIPGVISASFVGFVDQEALILDDLKGKRIGFLRPSMLATQLAKRHLGQNDIVAKEYFGETLYLANHNSALNALRVGRVDAIVIASAVYGAHDGEFDGRGLIIIEQTRSVPQYAFSVNRKLPATTRYRLKQLLLTAHRHSAAADFFKLRIVERTIPADISVYQPYRRMLQYITD